MRNLFKSLRRPPLVYANAGEGLGGSEVSGILGCDVSAHLAEVMRLKEDGGEEWCVGREVGFGIVCI